MQIHEQTETLIAQLQQENDRLKTELAEMRSRYDTLQKSTAQNRQAPLLSTVATVANLLLRTPDYTTVLPDVVRLLGEAVGSDRCGIGQNILHPVSGKLAVKTSPEWEWRKTGVFPTEEFSPNSDRLFLWQNDAPYIDEQLLQGKAINCLVADLPEPDRTLLASQGNTAELFVPILVNHQLWGFIAFDRCGEPRLYDEAEIAILQVAAESLAAAIARQAQDDALREAERRYRTLFELSSEGIYRVEFEQPIPLSLSVDEQVEWQYRYLHVIEANTTFAEMYGFDRPEDAIGLRLTDIHVSDSEQNFEFMRSLVENGCQIRNHETEEIDRHGNRLYLLNNIISDIRDGYVYGNWGTCINITELKQAQQALLEAERSRSLELERLNAELQQRDRLLSVTAQITKDLLKAENTDIAIPLALQAIGEVANMSRVMLFLECQDPATQKLQHHIIHEWTAAGIFDHQSVGLAVLNNEDFPTLVPPMYQGKSVWQVIDYFPNETRSHFERLAIKSSGVVPIFLEGRYFGCVAFDDCVTSRQWSQQEINVLITAAESIGAALHRKHLVERAIEERIRLEQERSLELERFNTELQQTLNRLSESEERYRTLFELSSEGIYRFEFTPPFPTTVSIDEQVELSYYNFRYAEVNQTFVEQYGLITPDQIVGKGVIDFWAEESQVGLESHRRIIENGYRLRGAESEEVYADGTLRHFLWNTVCDVKDGYVWGGWGIQTDITELRLAQQALLKAEQDRVAELAKTNQALKNSLDRLAADPDLNAFLGHVVLEITQQLQLDTAWVELYNPSTQTLQIHLFVERGHLRLKHDLPDMGKITQGYSASDEAVWNWVLQTQQPLVITVDTLPQFFRGKELETMRQWGQGKGIQSGINILLIMGDEPLGLLILFSTERTTFSKEELELAQALAQQATLAIQLTRLAEEAKQAAIFQERSYIATEVHDTLAQDFAGILMQLQAFSAIQSLDRDRAQIHFDRALALCKKGLVEARRSVWCLQQDSDRYGELTSILQQLVEQLGIGTSVEIQFQTQGEPYTINPEAGRHLFRIVQESLNNALRHANAQTIQVQLTYHPKQIAIAVRDDGCGFDRQTCSQRGFGLDGMQQRASLIDAQLTIDSQPGSGTALQISLAIV